MKGRIKFKKLVIIILLGVFSIAYVRQEVTMKRLSEEIDIKQEQLDEAQGKNERLQDEVDQANTDEYIERLARERLGMIKDGEKVIINSDTPK